MNTGLAPERSEEKKDGPATSPTQYAKSASPKVPRTSGSARSCARPRIREP